MIVEKRESFKLGVSGCDYTPCYRYQNGDRYQANSPFKLMRGLTPQKNCIYSNYRCLTSSLKKLNKL